MTEYIERNAAVRALTLHDCDSACAKVAILDLPATDVAPVVHGRWDMEVKGKPNDGGTYGINVCSVCGHSQHISAKGNYCPNCGAKMDKEEKDGEQ